jgi:hypothetical protein
MSCFIIEIMRKEAENGSSPEYFRNTLQDIVNVLKKSMISKKF